MPPHHHIGGDDEEPDAPYWHMHVSAQRRERLVDPTRQSMRRARGHGLSIAFDATRKGLQPGLTGGGPTPLRQTRQEGPRMARNDIRSHEPIPSAANDRACMRAIATDMSITCMCAA
jgi:hypothetical protein